MQACQTLRALRGVSQSPDPAVAANELASAIYQPDASLVVIYCSPNYDLPWLADEISRLFGSQNVIGCTTAGEITPSGYIFGGLAGVSLAGEGLTVATTRIPDLGAMTLGQGEALARSLIADIGDRGRTPSKETTFGHLLVDGMSQKEEMVAAALHLGLAGLPMVGGSAGDGTRFKETFLYHQGEFHQNCAIISLIQVPGSIEVFKCEHFAPSETKMIITEADPTQRIVREINGRSAAREYARSVGVSISGLNPLVYATHPVVMRAGGSNYVRSIQKANPDESLTFFCAIEEGLVLSVGQPANLVESLQHCFEGIKKRMGTPQLVMGCDCVLRYLEIGQTGVLGEVHEIFKENNTIGFVSYGEQLNGVHLNQTFVGVALSNVSG